MESEVLDKRMVREATLGLSVLMVLLATLAFAIYWKTRALWSSDESHLHSAPVTVYEVERGVVLGPTKAPSPVPLPNIESNEIVDLGGMTPMSPERLAALTGSGPLPGESGLLRVASVGELPPSILDENRVLETDRGGNGPETPMTPETIPGSTNSDAGQLPTTDAVPRPPSEQSSTLSVEVINDAETPSVHSIPGRIPGLEDVAPLTTPIELPPSSDPQSIHGGAPSLTAQSPPAGSPPIRPSTLPPPSLGGQFPVEHSELGTSPPITSPRLPAPPLPSLVTPSEGPQQRSPQDSFGSSTDSARTVAPLTSGVQLPGFPNSGGMPTQRSTVDEAVVAPALIPAGPNAQGEIRPVRIPSQLSGSNLPTPGERPAPGLPRLPTPAGDSDEAPVDGTNQLTPNQLTPNQSNLKQPSLGSGLPSLRNDAIDIDQERESNRLPAREVQSNGVLPPPPVEATTPSTVPHAIGAHDRGVVDAASETISSGPVAVSAAAPQLPGPVSMAQLPTPLPGPNTDRSGVSSSDEAAKNPQPLRTPLEQALRQAATTGAAFANEPEKLSEQATVVRFETTQDSSVPGVNDPTPAVSESMPGAGYSLETLKAAMRRTTLPPGVSMLDLSQQLYGTDRYAMALMQLNHRRADSRGHFIPGTQVMYLPAAMLHYVYPELVLENADPGSIQAIGAAAVDRPNPIRAVDYQEPLPESSAAMPTGRSPGVHTERVGASPVRGPTANGGPQNGAGVATPKTTLYVTEGGETLFELATEHLGQASHYVWLWEWNRPMLEGKYRPTDRLPRGLQLHMGPRGQ
jgi:hypothetical protein